jgi:hypothetical protein
MAELHGITINCRACNTPVLLPITTAAGPSRDLGVVELHLRLDPQPMLDHLFHHAMETAMMSPTLGRIVHYRLTQGDVDAIKALPRQNNPVEAGQVVAAVVVRVWSGTTCNLRVLLDGQDDYWATSRTQGDENGTWNWPQHITT